MASAVELPVLITAGNLRLRNLCARVIHLNGRRAHGPFVAIGAGEPDVSRYYERAGGGTLFIDDIGKLDWTAQFTLLRLLDGRLDSLADDTGAEHRRVRIITGASRLLSGKRRLGRFSDDLFYRLNAVHINLAPPRRQQPR